MTELMGFSPGKVIVSGEHSVGTGEVALVSALTLGVEIRLAEVSLGQSTLPEAFRRNVNRIFQEKTGHDPEQLFSSVRAELPFGSGLGSSAALAHAFFRAAAEYFSVTLSLDEMFTLVQQSEVFAHGEPSGVDASAVVRGGLLEFQKVDGQFHLRSLQAPDFSQLNFVLIDSGKPLETTKDMVTLVRGRYQAEAKIPELMKTVGHLTREIIQAVEDNSFDPEMLKVNQRYLAEMGIVGEKAQQMIHQIETAGGVAKVTGAGGIEAGSGMLLAYHSDPTALTHLIAQQQWISFSTHLGQSS